jgi:Tfp pilus assembly protein PilV
MHLGNPRKTQAGITLLEVLMSVGLLATFFASIFELNAVCLRYIDASKESVAALQSIHDRAEALRNLSFTDLTSAAYIQGIMGNPANTSEFCKKATEVVKISAFPTPNGATQFTRNPNGTVTTNSTAADLGSTLVQIDVSTTWNMTLGGRGRSEQTSTIVSNGSKK